PARRRRPCVDAGVGRARLSNPAVCDLRDDGAGQARAGAGDGDVVGRDGDPLRPQLRDDEPVVVRAVAAAAVADGAADVPVGGVGGVLPAAGTIAANAVADAGVRRAVPRGYLAHDRGGVVQLLHAGAVRRVGAGRVVGPVRAPRRRLIGGAPASAS